LRCSCSAAADPLDPECCDNGGRGGQDLAGRSALLAAGARSDCGTEWARRTKPEVQDQCKRSDRQSRGPILNRLGWPGPWPRLNPKQRRPPSKRPGRPPLPTLQRNRGAKGSDHYWCDARDRAMCGTTTGR
jgi:hypothetical protein